LVDIYSEFQIAESVIYCQNNSRVQNLSENLEKAEISVSQYTGKQCSESLAQFRNGNSRILVTSCVNVDLHQPLTIFYDLPRRHNDYFQLLGRSGKFGRKATAIILHTTETANQINEIERFFSTKIEELPYNFYDYL